MVFTRIPGTVGVQGECPGKVEHCPVTVAGDLAYRISSPDSAYADKVRVCNFQDFDLPEHRLGENVHEEDLHEKQSLLSLMNSVKPSIEDEDFDVRDEALAQLHDRFMPVVQSILSRHPKMYTAGLDETVYSNLATDDGDRPSFDVKKYAKPNYRASTGHYANYLHNDAWIRWEPIDSTAKVAMVNVWFILNETPPNNQLVFFKTTANNTVQSHMLHTKPSQVQNSTVVFDSDMRWGRFYLFVAGQLNTSESVLLHGAMGIPNIDNEELEDAILPKDHSRRSVEMRYTVHLKTNHMIDDAWCEWQILKGGEEEGLLE